MVGLILIIAGYLVGMIGEVHAHVRSHLYALGSVRIGFFMLILT